MHTYSSDAADRSLTPWVLACFAVALTYACSRLIAVWDITWPWWVENPSIMLFYGALWKLSDCAGWRWRVLGYRWSKIPDLRGTWIGTFESSYNGHSEKNGCLRIYQTWSRILLEFESSSSRSVSRMAALNVEPGANQGLLYEYANDPRFAAVDSMHAHRGVATLRVSNDGQRLEGEYFTGRDRQTHGSIIVERISKEHLDLNKVQQVLQMKKEEHER